MTKEPLAYALARLAQKKAVLARRRKAKALARRPAPRPEPALSATQRTGRDSEERPGRYMEDSGLTILGRHLRGKTGEIDLVAFDHGVLAFIDVRPRNSSHYGRYAAS